MWLIMCSLHLRQWTGFFVSRGVAWLIFLAFTVQVSFAAEPLLVFPLTNLSRKTQYSWLSEAMAYSLTRLFKRNNVPVIEGAERQLACERLGLLIDDSSLTLASAIKIGEKTQAGGLLLGSYDVTTVGKELTLTVSLRLINPRLGQIVGNPSTFSRPLREAQLLQQDIAKEFLSLVGPPVQTNFVTVPILPFAAYESYLRATLAATRQDRIRYLFRAITEYQKNLGTNTIFPAAAFDLGLIYYRDSNYKDAAKWLEKVTNRDAEQLADTWQAQFYCALSYLQLGEIDKAQSLFKQLRQELPVAEVLNNEAITLLRRDNIVAALGLLKSAVMLAPRDEDLVFNYGYALWRAGEYGLAIAQLQPLIERKKDGQASYLLAKCYGKLGQLAEELAALDAAKRFLPEFAKWETAAKLPPLARLKDQFSRQSSQSLTKTTNQLAQAQAQKALIEETLARAQGLFLAGRDLEAIPLLRGLVERLPDQATAHFLLGRIYERQGDLTAAIQALKTAVFWQPNLLAAQVLLGRIYFHTKNYEQARAQLMVGQALNAQDREVLALAELLKSSP
jgi:tetratricopeptide (TPR) repeat protein